MDEKRYINYHKHTMYSNVRVLDSIAKPEEYMKRAVELGHKEYCTMEHGFQGNIFEAQKLCEEKYDLKPIYGVEAYYVDDLEDPICSKERGYHLCLIALTEKARKEINNILSIANLNGFYYKPRIDKNLLFTLTPEETIVTTACVAGRLFKPTYYDCGEKDKQGNPIYKDNPIGWMSEFFIPVKKYFKENFYLEVQNHNCNVQIEHNKKILDLSKTFNVPIIHANDSHYILPEDSKNRDLFLRAKRDTSKKAGDAVDSKYKNDNPKDEIETEVEKEDIEEKDLNEEFILDYPDYDTIVERYRIQGVLSDEEIEQALQNTLIFDKAEPIHIDKEFKIPKIVAGDSNEYLKDILGKAWTKEKEVVKAKRIPKYKEAIAYEYNIIKKCGMADYFILDHLIVKKAIEDYGAVLTHSGRGSAVSFYVNKLLGLTEVDRIKAPIKLFPTRFMSAERILQTRSLPDIDLNFASDEPVVKASKDYLGEDGIRQMVAYKPLQASSAFRLYCKGRGYEESAYKNCGKMLGIKGNTDEDVKLAYPEWATQVEESKIFRGVVESISPSPCSFLLSNEEISKEVGLIRVGDEKKKSIEYCCCLDGYYCDYYKYLKNDYLTVTVWDIIDQIYDLLGKPIDDISYIVNHCDQKVWDLYAKGITTTINQADSDFDKQILKAYQPKNLSELSAYVAAIRPGFASLLNNFVHRQPYSTGVQELDSILEDSFHYLMYQESIMAYLVWLGMEEKGTYDIIKKISKKKFKPEELEALKKDLIKGWVNNVGTEEGFAKTWKVVEDASRYSFNASHSLSVAIDSLYGAYLKANYPLEYYNVAFNVYSDDMKRTGNLTNELDYFGIALKDVEFGKSKGKYSMDKKTNAIYKGIGSIKYLNENVANELYDLAHQNNYTNFISLLYDINNKTGLNNRQLGILIGLNYFKDFGKNKYLIELTKIYNDIGTRKQINKKDIGKIPIGNLDKELLTEDLIRKYANKELPAIFKQIDFAGIINELSKNIADAPLSVVEQIKFEIEYLGYPIFVNSKVSDKFYCVLEFTTYKSSYKPYLMLYQIKTGKMVKTKVTKENFFMQNPFKQYSIINIVNFREDFKRKKMPDGSWKKTEEKEQILNDWVVIQQ